MARSYFDRDVPGPFDRDRDDRGYGDRHSGRFESRSDREWNGGSDRYDRGPDRRMGDEVRSRFGDDEAGRRRGLDDTHDDSYYRRQYDDRDDDRPRRWGTGNESESSDREHRAWSDYRSVGDRGRDDGNRLADDREQFERGGRRFDGVTRSDFDQSRYGNPREEPSGRDRGYERVYRAGHGQSWGPGGYSRSGDAPWSAHRAGGGGDTGRDTRSGYDNDWPRDGREERSTFERAGDEVRSWFGDDEAERRRREDTRRDRRSGERFDDHPATDRSSDRWW